MSSAWVAASVRGRALARRRLGLAGTRRLAAAGSLEQAIADLAETAYGHDVRPGDDIAAAQHNVAAALLWHLRVLGGWVPRSGTPALRALGGAFEVANVDEHLCLVTGGSGSATFRLGSFATAWPRLVATTTPHDLREVLATSAWGDPGSDGVRTVRMHMRLRWTARVADAVPFAAPWMAGASALIVAREQMVDPRRLPDAVVAAAEPTLGSGWAVAHSPAQPLAGLAREAVWAVDGVHDLHDLWRAEARWWKRVESDAFTRLRGSSFDVEPVVAGLAVLAVDAWRVRAALETVAGRRESLELFDAVA